MKSVLKNNRLRVFIPLSIVIFAVLAGCWYWYRDYAMYISSDDAHVDADNVAVSSKIPGRIANLYADEGYRVSKGMLLADLDSSDLVAQKYQAIALRAQAAANVSQAEAKYNSDSKSIKILEINLERAKDDMSRARSQIEGGVITPEQFDHMLKTYETAVAQVDAAKALLTVSKVQISTAHAAVESADAQVNIVETQLRNTRLYAPFDGVVSKRWLMPGDVTQMSQSVFTLTNNKKLWVVVFLEETKISNIQTGKKVNFTIDAFPKEKFHGQIYMIGNNTAAMFSLIPPNNASGNFTKITQRIPLRISIDSTDSQKDISSLNIMAGMSAVVKIIK
jgi:membrane fusion protein (multidrug efflux system)